MSKRLISTNSRSETILKDLDTSTTSISGFINSSIINEALPVYSHLRVDSLYLLDVVTDGAKDWTGGKLVIDGSSDPRDNIPYYIRQTLARGVDWLRDNHHIAKGEVLGDIVTHYHNSAWAGGSKLDDQNEYVQQALKSMHERILKMDEKDTPFIGIGQTARDVLSHWKDLWDDDAAYEIISICIRLEALSVKIPPMYAIKLMQRMETEFILQAIGEK